MKKSQYVVPYLGSVVLLLLSLSGCSDSTHAKEDAVHGRHVEWRRPWLGLLLGLTGCASDPAAQDEAVFQALAAAVAAPERPGADREDDANRKPAQVLAALGIRPGILVLYLLAAGGYYSEILSRAVGDQGSVVFHNNQAYRDFIGVDVIAQRTAGGRLANVEVLNAELADMRQLLDSGET